MKTSFSVTPVAAAVKDSVAMINCGYNHHTKVIFFLFGLVFFGAVRTKTMFSLLYFIGTIGYICAAKRRRGLLSPSRFRTTWTKFSGKKTFVEDGKEQKLRTINRFLCIADLGPSLLGAAWREDDRPRSEARGPTTPRLAMRLVAYILNKLRSNAF